MRLAAYIAAHEDAIIGEWEDFARTLTPGSESATPLALRDHINEILAFIAEDTVSHQSEAEDGTTFRQSYLGTYINKKTRHVSDIAMLASSEPCENKGLKQRLKK